MRVIGNEGKHVCTFRDKSHGRQPCAPCLGFVWLGKVAQHNSGVHSAAGKLVVAGNGRGVIVGCLQQYQKTMGIRPDGNQVERHGRTHSMASSSNSSSGRSHGGIRSRCFVSRFFFGPVTYRGRGVQVWSS